MTAGKKVTLGCGGLVCLVIFLPVVVYLYDPKGWAEAERRLQEEQKQRENDEKHRAEVAAQQEQSLKLEEEAKRRQEAEHDEARKKQEIEDSFLIGRDGQPLTVTNLVTQVRYGGQDQELGKGKVFPEGGFAVAWEAARNIKGEGGARFTIYRYRSEEDPDEFAVELRRWDPFPLSGRTLSPGCYRYLGTMEGESLTGNPVSIMTFRRESVDHPLCRSRPDENSPL